MDSLNCLSGVFWFAIPFLMIVFSFFSLSWWRFSSSLAFATAWLPVCVLSFFVWMPLVEGVDRNEYPYSKLLETKRTNEYTDECNYRITFQALGPVGNRRTRETHLMPGLKWVEITDQNIYGLSAINKVLQ